MNPTLWLLTALIAGLLITLAYRVGWPTQNPRNASERPVIIDSQVDAKTVDRSALSARSGSYRSPVAKQRDPIAPTGSAQVDPVNTRTVEAKAQAAARHDAYTGGRTANPYRGAIRARLWLASYQRTLVEHHDA